MPARGWVTSLEPELSGLQHRMIRSPWWYPVLVVARWPVRAGQSVTGRTVRHREHEQGARHVPRPFARRDEPSSRHSSRVARAGPGVAGEPVVLIFGPAGRPLDA